MSLPHQFLAYREATNSTTSHASTFTCAVCGGHHLTLGRRKIQGAGRVVRYRCAVCVRARDQSEALWQEADDLVQLLKAWARLEFDIAQRGRCADVSIETIAQVRAMLGLEAQP